MKLYHAPASPFARKVMACAIARGIEGQITLVPAHGGSGALEAVNPLDKIPCLVTDDGLALYDSRVICEYLDSVGDVPPLFPGHGLRIRALRFQALADGIMDAAVLVRAEQGRPRETARDEGVVKQARKIAGALKALEQDMPPNHLDIGTIAVVCALGYLDLRFATEPWRGDFPKLAAWFEAMMRHPCMAQTIPG